MKKVFLILVFVMASNAAVKLTPGIRVKFSVGGSPGVTYFFKVPLYVTDAKAMGWSITKRPPGPVPELSLYCPAEKCVCALMDDTGYIGGLQVAFPKNLFTDNILDLKKRGFGTWTTDVNGETIEFWYIQELFISKETLKKSKKERLASRDTTRVLQENAIWLTGPRQQLLKVSTSEKNIRNSIFTEQACLPSMGNHYYYNMTAVTECSAELIYPWFLMTHKGEMIATGCMAFGKLKVKDGARDWFEHPGLATVMAVVPYGPDCLYKLANNPGSITMHIFLVDDPWNITCDENSSKTPTKAKY